MSSRGKNTFSRAVRHIKSTKFDVVEAAPVNSTSGFMTVTPNAPNPDYVPPNYPPAYKIPNFDTDTQDDGKDTTGLFAEDGTPKTSLPPVTESSPDRSYILGPMASMWYAWANATRVGYVRQSDRKMVNLGSITGKLSDWDGASGFTSYGQLTLEQTVWYKNVAKAPGQTNDPATANYRAFYPGPPSNSPDSNGRYYCTITGEPLDQYSPAEGEPKIPPVQGEMSPDDNYSAQVAGLGGLVGGLAALASFLGMTMGAAKEWWDNASPEERQKIKDLLNPPDVATVPSGPNSPLPAPGWTPRPGSNFRPGPMWNAPKPGGGSGTWGTTIKLAHRELKGKLLSESKRSIIKNLKKPVVIPETKQKSYKVKPKIRGLENTAIVSKPVETPKEYKKIGGRHLWGQYEYQQNVRQSQERMNDVLELVGEGDQAFKYMITDSKRMNSKQLEEFWGLNPEMHSHFYNGKKYKVTRKEQLDGDHLVFLVDENGVKSNILQSELNEKLVEEEDKKLLDEYNKSNLKSKRNDRISYDKDPLFKKAYKKLMSYKDKPAVMGYPNDPPPKMVNGWHPEYGKRYKYDKLDPISAKAMPPTGNPEIDANVEKAKRKPK